MEARLEALERRLKSVEDNMAQYISVTEEQKQHFSDTVQVKLAEANTHLGAVVNGARAEFEKNHQNILGAPLPKSSLKKYHI